MKRLPAVLYLILALPVGLQAQIRGSERAGIRQIVNGTGIAIDYGRPHVRGRTMFGGQIHWGEVWTPGANLATTIEFTKDVRVEGEPVRAGTYSVWIELSEDGPWGLILEPDATLYHTQPPARHEGQVLVEVSPRDVPFTEALTFDFVRVEPDGTDLQMRFERAAIDLRIDVEAEPVPELSEAEAAIFVGTYEMAPPPGMPVPPGGAPTMELRWEDGRLLAVLPGPMGADEVLFVPAAEHVFQLGLLMDGELYEVEQDMYLEFVVEDGRAIRMEARGLEDRLMFAAERAN